MNLSLLDWAIIGAYFLISICIGLYMTKRGGRSTNDFFLSGRNLPWYIAGTSMVATTFAADTPLAVTELVAQKGIAGNWLWWNMLIGGMLTVFFFARFWRRSEIMTDAEFVRIRYSGKAAHFLRAFRTLYIGIFMNVIVIAWINLAMVKIITVMYPELHIGGFTGIEILNIYISPQLVVVACIMIFVAIYTSLSGLRGISLTDTFQFIMAMTGSIALAFYAVNHIGGIGEMKQKLAHVDWVFEFIPDIQTKTTQSATSKIGLLKMSITAFIAYIGVQWWASWYPGSEPGGGGYVAQRMMSAKDERHSLLATLWFQVAHYAIRPWPWIVVALAALILYPHEPDKAATYVMVIRDLLPSGLLGLLLAAFLAAYMSTVASQTVWGTSYIINDLYRPYINPDASEKKYVLVSRIITFVLMLLSLVVTTQFKQISDAWKFILACSGGIGLVLILRWFWWRINAWSEIAAMLAPYSIYPVLIIQFKFEFETNLIIIVMWSTFVWIVVTFLTKPTDNKRLLEFYAKIHPGGIGWQRIAKQMPHIKSDTGYLRLTMNWFCGCILIIFTLFGTGKVIFGNFIEGILFLIIAVIAGVIIYINLQKTGWEKIIE